MFSNERRLNITIKYVIFFRQIVRRQDKKIKLQIIVIRDYTHAHTAVEHDQKRDRSSIQNAY